MAATTKYRKTGHDIAPLPPKAIPNKPGTLPDHQIAIYDSQGRMRGRVHAGAISASVARFTVQHGAKLGVKDGRKAWISPPPKPRPNSRSDQRHEMQLAAAKGSVSSHPSAPAPARRPKR